jgi:DNA-binding transcriptional MocR family regulator
MSGPPGFHRWLPIPAGRTLIALVTQAAQAGITIAPPGALQQVDRGTLGIRLRLGHPAGEEVLENALLELRQILESAEAISFVSALLRLYPIGLPRPGISGDEE